MEKLGKWAFVAGLALCVVVSLVWELAAFVWVLVILGLVVGFLNVEKDETQRFLIAAIALTVASSGLEELPYFGERLIRIFRYFVAFVGPAAVVVAIRSLFRTGSE